MNGNAQIEQVIDAVGSVKKGDRLPFVDGKNGYITINLLPDPLFTSHLPNELPYNLWLKDRILLSTVRHESFWGAAVSIGVSKFATQGWEVSSDMPTLRKRYQQLIMNAEGGGRVGWNTFCRYFITSYYCTKAAVIEISRETHSMGSRITGLHHLDPLRCLLTNDPETPVLYQSLYDNKWHELKWWQVMVFSAMPDVTEMSGGAGICAAERSYSQIRKLAAIEQYILDKVTGRRPLALQIVSGMSDRQVRDAVNSGKADADQKGWVQFMGALVVTTPNPDTNLVTVPLAELPDGFDRKQEHDIALLAYANNLGLDPQDLQPLTGQQLGAGAQSQVLDEKAKGRDLKVLAEEVEKAFNQLVLPEKVQFGFTSKDLRDEKQQAENMNIRADWGKKLIEMAVLTSEQVNNILTDFEDIPADYRAIDTLNTGDLSDDEKPDLAEGNPENEGATVPPVEEETPLQQAEKSLQLLILDPFTHKATHKPTKEQKKRASHLIDEEMDRATRLYEDVA